MCEDCKVTISVEKVGEYKKAMKAFIKGMIRTKIAQDADGNLTVDIVKTLDKEKDVHYADLVVKNETTGLNAVFAAVVPTRVYNKIDPTLFEALAEQLSRTKNFGKLIVR